MNAEGDNKLEGRCITLERIMKMFQAAESRDLKRKEYGKKMEVKLNSGQQIIM